MFDLQQVTFGYGQKTVLRVDRLEIGTAPVTAILGRNGSGKSTMLRLLAREIRPSSGTIRLNGTQLGRFSHRSFAQQVAHLPQNVPAAPGLTVRELCALGRFPWRGALGAHRAEDREIVEASLVRTGLSGEADRMVETLSGGERQRAWIAMLLAQQAPILLLDEPTSALDLVYQAATLDLLRDLTGGDIHVVLVMHDVNLAARYADRIIALRAGIPVYDGSAADFMDSGRLRDVYDVDMLIARHPTTHTPYAIHV
ncbi:MAG: ABC transporter ATP-binding protein [Pseudomonadota bacterium]